MFVALLGWAYHKNDAADLLPVWQATHAFLHGGNAYGYQLFVYPPSALLLLAPIGLMGFNLARTLFAVADAGMILLAAFLCLRLFRIPLRSATAPLIVLATALFAPVGSTLHLDNVNGLVVAGEIGAFLAASRGRWAASGWLLGLTLAVKPVLLPLILIPILWRHWEAVMRALIVPLSLSILALLLSAHSSEFFSSTLPFLINGDAHYLQTVNVSLNGALSFVGVSGGWSWLLRLPVAGSTAYLVWLRYRQPGDELSRLLDCSLLVLLAAFLSFSFSWNYYALYLLPSLIAVALGRSFLPRRSLWVPLFLIGSPDVFLWRHSVSPIGGASLLPHLASARVTSGYLVLLGAFAYALGKSNLARLHLGPVWRKYAILGASARDV